MDTLDELTQSQKDILSQYQAVTQSDDLDASIARLTDHNWNLERAIQSLYDGTRTTREKLEEEVAASTRSSAATSSSNNASPPIPPRPARRRFGILSLLTWPFGFAWNISWAILTFASRFFARPSITSSHSSSTQRQDSRTVAARFLRNFETKYGETHVDFFQGGYSQALEIARRELRFLLVILQSDEHDDTPKFCSETLTSNELIDWFRQNNILVWGGNVADAEAYQVSNTLQATTYPFMAIIALQSLHGSSGSMKMSVVDRIEGPATPSIVIRRFENAMQRYGTTLNRMRLERDQREMERRLRQEQDQAYRESLRADQEKERKAREEREAAARAEEEARRAEQDRQLLAEKRKQHIRYLCKTLPAEPDASYQGQVAKLSFRLADGERVIRKFRGEESLETLYQFVESYPFLKAQENVQDAESPEGYTHKYNFTIISPYPRTVYQADKEKAISEEKGLWPSATLIVDAEDEEDGDE